MRRFLLSVVGAGMAKRARGFSSAADTRSGRLLKESYYGNQRRLPVLPTHVLDPRTEKAKVRREMNVSLSQCDTAITHMTTLIESKRVSQNAWSDALKTVESLWSHLLPSHVASLLAIMATKQTEHKEDGAFIERLVSRFERFSDVKSFWRSLTALKKLKYPVDDLAAEFMSHIEESFPSLTFEDLRYTLLGLAVLFPSVQRDPRRKVADACTPVASDNVVRALCCALGSRIRDAVKAQQYRRNPKRLQHKMLDARNRRRVGLRQLVRGMIGLDNKDFFFIPYALARLRMYDQYLLDRSMASIRAYVTSRLPIRYLEVLLAADGLDFFSAACASTGVLSQCAFNEIVGPTPFHKLPHPRYYELQLGELRLRTEDGKEALATGALFSDASDRCLTMARFLLTDMSVPELLEVGNRMSVNGLQSVKVWKFWADFFEEDQGYRFDELDETQLWTMKRIWENLNKPSNRILYRLALCKKDNLQHTFSDPPHNVCGTIA